MARRRPDTIMSMAIGGTLRVKDIKALTRNPQLRLFVAVFGPNAIRKTFERKVSTRGERPWFGWVNLTNDLISLPAFVGLRLPIASNPIELSGP